jgi:hypothetical protein
VRTKKETIGEEGPRENSEEAENHWKEATVEAVVTSTSFGNKGSRPGVPGNVAHDLWWAKLQLLQYKVT